MANSPQRQKISLKTCSRCGATISNEQFLKTKNPFYFDGLLPVCNGCIVDFFKEDFRSEIDETSPSWQKMDKFCQFMDVPFQPQKFLQLWKDQKFNAVVPYVRMFQERGYDQLDWREQESIYRDLEKEGALTYELVPKYNEKKLMELREKWGQNYDDEALIYLEQLFDGVTSTQNINGALQMDQALKLCRVSYLIDSRVREGLEIDKPLGAYEKLVKVADFTPKNVKNAQDFDSVGELFAYLEKTGYVNKFYDGVTRDIVDVTMNNIQTFCQRLYTNEPGIGDSIEKRIESLKRAKEIENDSMGLDADYTTDTMNDFVEEYMEEEFEVDV